MVPLLKPDSLQKATLGCGRAVEGDHGVSSERCVSPGMWQVAAYIAAVPITSRRWSLLTDGELHVLPLDLPRWVFSG